MLCARQVLPVFSGERVEDGSLQLSETVKQVLPAVSPSNVEHGCLPQLSLLPVSWQLCIAKQRQAFIYIPSPIAGLAYPV